MMQYSDWPDQEPIFVVEAWFPKGKLRLGLVSEGENTGLEPPCETTPKANLTVSFVEILRRRWLGRH